MGRPRADVILLAHGDGGALTRQLVDNLFHKHLTDDRLGLMADGAILPPGTGRLALTTDSFVVQPLFFPGGDIGKLAVCGTVNDLAVSGAVPRYLAASFMIEEGLELAVLETIVASMAAACRESGVEIVAADTKVVERGSLDKLFITTTGVGWLPEEVDLGYHRVSPGDLVLVNGNLGDHGVAVIATRHGLDLAGRLVSDCASLNGIICDLMEQCPGIKLMRDLTRGGLATAAKEIALSAGVDIWLGEDTLPVAAQVRGAADMLGLDPLYLANEGKFLAIIDPQEVELALALMREHPLGRNAELVGEVRPGKGNLFLKTALGGTRIVDLMTGNSLPRIC